MREGNVHYAKRYAHQHVEEAIREREKELQRLKEVRKIRHDAINQVPKILWERGAWSAWSGSASFVIPWDMKYYESIRDILLKAGWTFRREYSPSDKKSLYFDWCPPVSNKGEFILSVIMSAAVEGSKCVLVPIATETIVTAYDHVCPDEHPELFKTDENGNLVYIGDNVFPAIKV